MNYDWAWKRLFSLPVMVEHLLRGFAAPAAGLLDFDTLEPLPASWTGEAAEQRHGDAVWRVRYRDGSGRSLFVPVEFQSRVDLGMRSRVSRYVDLAHQTLRRQGALDADGEFRALPVVVHSCDERWTAPGAAAQITVTGRGEVSMAPPHSYLAVDAWRDSGESDGRDNPVAMVFALEGAESPGEM